MVGIFYSPVGLGCQAWNCLPSVFGPLVSPWVGYTEITIVGRPCLHPELCKHLSFHYHHYPSSSLKSCFLDKTHINKLAFFFFLIIMIFINIIIFSLLIFFVLFFWTRYTSSVWIAQQYRTLYKAGTGKRLCKEPDDKCFWLCRPYSLSHSCSTLLWEN